jgi:alkylhydroperoxidase/carboxymuconolactone decarboxylase family protein YurZ
MSGREDSTLAEELSDGVEALVAASLEGQRLPLRIKYLALAFAFSNKGRDEDSRKWGRQAIAEGITTAELAEALCAGVLSRGVGIDSANSWLLAEAEPADPQIAGQPAPNANEIVAYFDRTFGGVPGWLDLLVETSPPTLETYYGLRAEILRDGVLPRRDKELILVVMNAAERYDVGMRVHMGGALDAGAEPADLLEAVRAAIPAGGMVAWLSGADVYAEVMASRAGS